MFYLGQELVSRSEKLFASGFDLNQRKVIKSDKYANAGLSYGYTVTVFRLLLERGERESTLIVVRSQ